MTMTVSGRTLLSYALQRLVGRVPGVGLHRYVLVAVPRDALPAMPRGFEVRCLSATELSSYRVDLVLPEAALHFRLRQGMECLGAFRNGRLMGAIWLVSGRFDEDEILVRFLLPPGAAWDTGLYIRPEARGGRAFAALWAGAAAWLDARGLHWSVSRIADYNVASLQSHARMGARRIGTVDALRIGRWQLVPQAEPRLARMHEDRRPLLTILLSSPSDRL